MLSDGVTTFGFKTLRLRVKNGTADVNDPGKGKVPQTMKAGTGPDGSANGYLVAIARYHRNPCYQPDLSGEYVTTISEDGSVTNGVPSGCTISPMRTAYQEISVSAHVQLVDSNGNLPGPPPGSMSACANVGNINTGADSTTGACANSSALMEFDFSADPIPINATDLFLQVAYRGQLGEETDGIAVGMIDLMEPSSVSLVNNTDWYFDGQNNWVDVSTENQNPNLPQEEREMSNLYFCLGSQMVFSNHKLEPRQFSRLSILTDQTQISSLESWIPTYLNNGVTQPRQSGTFNDFLVPRQSDKEDGGQFVNYVDIPGLGEKFGMDYFRGIIAGYDWYIPADNNWLQVQSANVLLADGIVSHLTPEIGGSLGPGVPKPVPSISFTSAPDVSCPSGSNGNSFSSFGFTNDRKVNGSSVTSMRSQRKNF